MGPTVGDPLADKYIIERIKFARTFNKINNIGFFSNLIALGRFNIKDFVNSGLTNLMISTSGFDEDMLQTLIADKVTFKTFFEKAKINPNAHLIKRVVCGYRIEEIEDKFEVYKQCRRMEKLIDELAKGRKMEKILQVEKK